MASFAKRFISSIANSKIRTFIIIGASLVIGISVMIFFSVSSQQDPFAAQPTVTGNIPRNIQSIPGGEATERYKKLQEADNQRRIETARKSGKTAIPTIIASKETPPKKPEVINSPSKPEIEAPIETLAPPAQSNNATRLANLLAEQEKQRQAIVAARDLSQKQSIQSEKLERDQSQILQAQAKKIEELNKNMAKKAGELVQASTVFPTQAFVTGNYKAEDLNLGTSGSLSGSLVQNQTGQYPPGSTKLLIKAGTVLFGILDTGVTTDEPSPVLATIVSGPYKGGKLMGTIQVVNQTYSEKVILNFNTMGMPTKDHSFSVQVVAIDPETARTALASDVDHHYLLRYGSLFASSFMKGFGQAISQAGTTTTTASDGGSTTSTKPALNTKDKVFAAFGEVGTAWGQEVGKAFNRPATITVDAGTALGLLFLSDIEEDLDGNIVPIQKPFEQSTGPQVAQTTTTTSIPTPTTTTTTTTPISAPTT